MPPTYFFASIVLMLLLHWLLPVWQIVPWPWGLLGLVPLIGWLFALADALLIFRDSRKCLHDNIADTIVVTASKGESITRATRERAKLTLS